MQPPSPHNIQYLHNIKTLFYSYVGHSCEELHPCIQWMKCFSDVILEKGSATLKNFESVPREDVHNIQTHAVEIGLLVSKYCTANISIRFGFNNQGERFPLEIFCYIPKAFTSDSYFQVEHCDGCVGSNINNII